MNRLSQLDRFSAVISRCFSQTLALSLFGLNILPLAVTIPVYAVEHPTPAMTVQRIDADAKTQVLPLPAAAPSDDLLNSQYAIPWQAIQQAQDTVTRTGQAQSFQYRTPVSTAPDQQTQAYSELHLTLHPKPSHSFINSQLIIETKTQTYRFPSTLHLELAAQSSTSTATPGTFSIIMPAAWSADGQSLLLRQFEGLFGSDMASDYALVWQSSQSALQSYRPTAIDYDSATLMGWSQNRPGEILFQTRLLGNPTSQLVTVNPKSSGTTLASSSDRPMQVTVQPQPSTVFRQTLK
jgi:hypothetical protein